MSQKKKREKQHRKEMRAEREAMKVKGQKCPVCNTGIHFAGKVMEYEEGILVENDCRRCGGTGFLKPKAVDKPALPSSAGGSIINT